MCIQVKDIMSAPVKVAMIDDNILEIRTLMKESGIHAIPIVSYTNDTLKVEETIKGIITSTDICENISDDALIEDVLKARIVHVVHINASVKRAAKMMLHNKVHHMVVMDDGDIKGMISSLDFVKLVAEDSLE